MISKSKYLQGLQCPKLLWVAINDKKRMPEVDASTQHIFDQGHVIGELATKCYEEGIEVPFDNFKGNIERTKELLLKRKPLFEAGILVDNLFARPDILNPVGDDEWDIIEVKSSTSVKDVNIQDVSFQKYLYEKAGLKIRKCFLMYINNKYVKDGGIDHKQLFVQEDITEDVKSAMVGIQERLEEMFKILKGNEPNCKIGRHCKDPYSCDLMSECKAFLPENSVDDLCCGGKKTFDLIEKGILSIKDIPEDYKLTPRQTIQRECEIEEKPHIDKEEISKWLDKLIYPLYYFDFETIGPAIPLFDGTKPYQPIPFQFSLHIQNEPGGELIHHSFLADGQDDPRIALLQAMRDYIGDEGNLIAYCQSFEIGRLKECAEAFSEYKEWIETLIPRFIDLYVPFSKFWYYNPIQKGSASIKKVLPAVTGESYDDMEIGNGSLASLEYERVTYGDNVSDEDRETVRTNLEKYCGLDTEGMVWIIDKLREMGEE